MSTDSCMYECSGTEELGIGKMGGADDVRN